MPTGTDNILELFQLVNIPENESFYYSQVVCVCVCVFVLEQRERKKFQMFQWLEQVPGTR